MNQVFPWIVTLLVLAVLGAFIWYLISLHQLPISGRPRTHTFDRLGRLIAEQENPDYHENPGEDSLADPGIEPDPQASSSLPHRRRKPDEPDFVRKTGIVR